MQIEKFSQYITGSVFIFSFLSSTRSLISIKLLEPNILKKLDK